jgi:hypothetical protein
MQRMRLWWSLKPDQTWHLSFDDLPVNGYHENGPHFFDSAVSYGNPSPSL